MQKIKDFVISDKGKDILTVCIIILVGLASYGLGRLSKTSSGDLKIEYTEPPTVMDAAVLGVQSVTKTNEPVKTAVSTPAPKPIPKVYFASTRGNKYYHPGCSGGKTLKEENKIYFNSAQEAEAAGYTISSSCR